MTAPPHPGPGHPDCHECGGSGLNAADLPCFACHHGANLAARRQRRATFVEALASGPDLPDGLLATTGQPSPYSAASYPVWLDGVTPVSAPSKADPEVWRWVMTDGAQPSPYSAATVEATVDHLRQRIRELEADLQEAQRERDDLRNLNESMRVCAESSTSIAERYTDRYKELYDAARAVVEAVKMQPCDICGRVALVVDRDGDPLCEAHAHLARGEKQDLPYAPAWRRLCALVKP